ncbi:hypothetical protein AWB76_05580 [Caballeronia temeraria]|uniref:Uncharacterized protein n=1 Tax=Caballeronia temeraria TaxID=1777137 RepID=A0A158CI21_9BURK|nr:hypothetical protein [Caballeronia temeraria]SAK81930.1 hypothetical protein AWB76_05580 [Caballeronia temeraria]
MGHILTYCWHMLSNRFEGSRERRFLREARRAMNACACKAPHALTRGDGEASCAERLEHIALFAQAGYFNMGNAVDMFQLPVEPPLFRCDAGGASSGRTNR